MPDPKLEAVRAEIQAVFARHDVAGMVVVASQTHAIYSLQLDASWNIARTGNGEIKFSTKELPEADKKAAVEATINVILGLNGATEAVLEQLQAAVKIFARCFHITHINQRERL